MDIAERRQSGRFSRLTRIFLVAVAALAIAALAVTYSIATLDLYAGLRQEQAGKILSQVFGRPVEVRGPVILTPGFRLGVRIEDSYIERPSGDGTAKARVFETVAFDAPYALLRGKVSGIRNFRMSGAEIEYAPGSAKSQTRQSSLFELPSTLINSPVLDNLELTDVLFRFVDPADGWDETFRINSLKLVTGTNAEATQFQFDAAVNGTPLTTTGTIPSSATAAAEKSGPFDLTIVFPGLETHLTGSVDTSGKVANVDGTLSSSSSSVTQLLTSLGFESAVDGSATLTWDASGPLDALDITDLKMAFDGENGDRITVAGTVNEAFRASTVNVHFKSVLAPSETRSANTFAVNVKEISGHVSGPLDALAVDEALITTDAILLDFDEIGPITVGRVIKGDDDKVGLKEITVLDGPAGAPYLKMTGEIDDLFALAGASLAGSYRFPTALLLNRAPTDAPELGFVQGTVALNETSGAFGLQELTGEVSGTDLLDLKFELTIPEFRVLDELDYSTELSLPEPAKVLSVLGVETGKALPAMSFKGTSGLSPEGAKLSGVLAAGTTVIQADVKLEPDKQDSAWVLAGSVSSDEMDFTDLAGLSDFATLAAAGFEDDTDIELTGEFRSALRADVALNVKKIVSGNKHAGNLKGELKYSDDHLTLDGLSLDYIGGSVRGDFGVNLASTNHPAHAHGRMEKFPLSRLMSEVGLHSPINSTVYASFDVSGNAVSETGFLRSLTGNVTASLWGGTLPNRLLDLSGLNVFTWLVTSNKDHTTKLVCAVLPLRFKNGNATTKSMIVETQNVQLVGAGSVDLKSGAMDLSFVPRAKRKQLVEIVSPFEIDGTLGKPDVKVKDAGPGRAIGEIVSLPINLVGHLFRGSGPIDDKARPCTLPKNTGPK